MICLRHLKRKVRSPMKLTEFYALTMPSFIFSKGLWRTALRWAKADAKSGGLNASLPGRPRRATEVIEWGQPWRVGDDAEGPPFEDLPPRGARFSWLFSRFFMVFSWFFMVFEGF